VCSRVLIDEGVTKLKVIFFAGAIRPPLTGIGRYAWELASRLRICSQIESLRFYQTGLWIEDLDSLLRANTNASPTLSRSTPFRAKKRRRWLRKPIWFKRWQQLHAYRDHVFHGPNYFIPQFAPRAVATIHDLSIFKYPETHPEDRLRQFEKELPLSLKRASHLITVSQATRLEVIDHFGWPANKVTAIPLGVSQRFAPHSRQLTVPTLSNFGLEFGAYSLCVSTIEPRKNIDGLLAAYREIPFELRRQYPLVLAGSKGWLSEKLHTLIYQYQAEGWLHYLGFVPDEDLPALYAGARMFVFPSVYEGFGLPVLEALASGVPVVTSNRSSLPEVAGGAALLIDPDDVDALRDGIHKALEDDPWRAKARALGLQVASAHTWERCTEQTLAVYRKVAGGSN
jgi:glycosyltransferase involved in cell wall biosynthesis